MRKILTDNKSNIGLKKIFGLIFNKNDSKIFRITFRISNRIESERDSRIESNVEASLVPSKYPI